MSLVPSYGLICNSISHCVYAQWTKRSAPIFYTKPYSTICIYNTHEWKTKSLLIKYKSNMYVSAQRRAARAPPTNIDRVCWFNEIQGENTTTVDSTEKKPLHSVPNWKKLRYHSQPTTDIFTNNAECTTIWVHWRFCRLHWIETEANNNQNNASVMIIFTDY